MFGGAGRAFVGEQGAGRARRAPGALGEQVQSVRVSRGWEDRWSPWCFGEQVQVMRVSRGLR